MIQRRALLILGAPAALTVAWAAVAPIWYVGDVGVCPSSVLPLVSTDEAHFDPAAWRGGDAAARGRMLTDLARRRDFEGKQASEVAQALGRNECYLHYDDEPCYTVEVGGTRRYLAMSVAHSGPQLGSILRVRLTSDPSAFFIGC